MKLFNIVALSLSITTLSMPQVLANGKPNSRVQTPHLMGGVAFPNYSKSLFADHKFYIHVEGKSLSEFEILLPWGIKDISEVEIKDNNGQKLNTQVSQENDKILVSFAEVVQPNTILLVKLKGVKTNGFLHLWQYQVYGKLSDLDVKLPLGVTRIPTY